MTSVALFTLLWSGTAHAQDPACSEPLTEPALVSALEAATAAIHDADPDTHTAITDELKAAIPCFDFVPKPEQWAEIMLGIAIVAHHAEEDWQSPLTTALTIHPDIDRLVGKNHGFYDWQPPPRPEPTDRVAPEGTRVFYDGLIVSKIPQPKGIHLVQRRDGDGLQTRLLVDEAIPEAWLVAPEVASKKRDLGWGVVGVGGGIRLVHQSPENPGTFAPETGGNGGGGAVASHGWLRLAGPMGLRFGVAGQTSKIGTLDARIGPAWGNAQWTVSAAASAHTASVLTGEERQSFLLVYPSLGSSYRVGFLTLSADAGWSPAITAANGRVDLAFGKGTLRPMVSARTHVSAGHFSIASDPVRQLPTTETGAHLEVGLAWGKRK